MTKKSLAIIVFTCLILTLCGCSVRISNNYIPSIQKHAEDMVNIRIISTSDTHGKMLGYDYISEKEDSSGSLAKAASAIKEYRNDNTILIDIGDAAQDNMADLFLDEEIHPMMQGFNTIGYDICSVGNHEFNFGMDFVKNYINSSKAKFLVGNIYDENNQPLADGYTIIEKDGFKVAVIAMVTPAIANWDKVNLEGYTVTDPAEETNRIINELKGKADVFVGVFHMMENDELQKEHSGFASMAEACPELDLILAAHGHTLVEGDIYNEIPVTENLNSGKSIQIADITVKKTSDNCEITDISTKAVLTEDYPEDEELLKVFAPYDKEAKDYAHTVIGHLVGGPLVNESEIKNVNGALLFDSALSDLVQKVMLYFSDADVASSSISDPYANAEEGDFYRSDVTKIYKYPNTLYKMQMTGEQLKLYMEWSASFYQQYEDGDLTIAFEDMPVYQYDTFSGVNYDINISKPVGSRIEHLTMPSGEPVKDDDVLTVAVSNYRANTILSTPGEIYEEGNLPVILEEDMCPNIGDIRAMIVYYIENECKGVIEPLVDGNWKIVGTDWDEDLHKKAVDAVNNEVLSLTEGSKGNPNTKEIRKEDLISNGIE